MTLARSPARALLGAVLAAAWLAAGCDRPKEKAAEPRGEFGVFFGGQIQERRDLPFVLDPTKQSQGFRVEWPEPLAADVELEWRIDRPAPRARKKPKAAASAEAAPAPVTTSGKGVARAGERRFDRTVPFEPGDPLGLWNVRVVAGGSVVIDRPFEVYDARDRARRSATDGGY